MKTYRLDSGVVKVGLRGAALLADAMYNKGTAFSLEERRELLGETLDTARANEAACRKCVAWYRRPDAESPCPDRPYAE